MPDIQYIGAGTEASSITTIAPTIHASTLPGDLMILVRESANEGFASPSGWTNMLENGAGTVGTGARIAFHGRFFVAGDGAPTSADPGNHQTGQIHTFRYVYSRGGVLEARDGSPIDTDIVTPQTGISVTGTTTTYPRAAVFYGCTWTTDTLVDQASAWANASLESITEIGDMSTDLGNGGGHSVAWGIKATPGATGTATGTLATSSLQANGCIALKPAVLTPFNLVDLQAVNRAGSH